MTTGVYACSNCAWMEGYCDCCVVVVIRTEMWLAGDIGCGTYMCLHPAVRIFLYYPNHHKKITPLINHITLVPREAISIRLSGFPGNSSSPLYSRARYRANLCSGLPGLVFGYSWIMPTGNPDNVGEEKTRVCVIVVLSGWYFLLSTTSSPNRHLRHA